MRQSCNWNSYIDEFNIRSLLFKFISFVIEMQGDSLSPYFCFTNVFCMARLWSKPWAYSRFKLTHAIIICLQYLISWYRLGCFFDQTLSVSLLKFLAQSPVAGLSGTVK